MAVLPCCATTPIAAWRRLPKFFPEAAQSRPPNAAQGAAENVHPDAVLGDNVTLEPNVVIGAGAQIGDGCYIGAMHISVMAWCWAAIARWAPMPLSPMPCWVTA